MDVVVYKDEYRELWDEFVENSNNGTMFHLQQFLDYHPAGKFDWHHLMFFEKGNLKAVLPGTFENGVYESPIGASYGSLVIPDITFKETMDLVSALLDWGKKNGVKHFILTSAPMIYENFQNQNLEFAMLWQGFNYQLHYISSAIKLDPARELLPRFQSTVRRNIRKSLKDPDIRVEVNERYDQFYP
ncbi:MAG: GNAT family N-acetyltransferase, partial [Ignavibacteria bacterium]